MYSFTVVSLDDRVNTVNVTIPYSSEYLPARSEISDYPEAMTTESIHMSLRLFPMGDNTTVIENDLPGSLPVGEDLALIVRFHLAGTVSGVEQTLWDKIFGLTGNLGAVFGTYRKDNTEDKTRIEFLFPHGWVVKRWEPRQGIKKYDERRDTISLEWSLAGKENQIYQLSAIYGEAN